MKSRLTGIKRDQGRELSLKEEREKEIILKKLLQKILLSIEKFE